MHPYDDECENGDTERAQIGPDRLDADQAGGVHKGIPFRALAPHDV